MKARDIAKENRSVRARIDRAFTRSTKALFRNFYDFNIGLAVSLNNVIDRINANRSLRICKVDPKLVGRNGIGRHVTALLFRGACIDDGKVGAVSEFFRIVVA